MSDTVHVLCIARNMVRNTVQCLYVLVRYIASNRLQDPQTAGTASVPGRAENGREDNTFKSCMRGNAHYYTPAHVGYGCILSAQRT